MNEINKYSINDQALIYYGMMLNKPIAFVESGEWDGWLMAQNYDGQWVSLNEIPNYKEMKQLIKNLNHQIRDMDTTISTKLSAISSLNKRIDELEYIINARLWKNRCVHCEKIFDSDETDEIIHDHIMNCEKSPVAIALKNANELNQGLAEGMDLAIDALKISKNTLINVAYDSTGHCIDCGKHISCIHDKKCLISNAIIKICCLEGLDSSLPIRNDKNNNNDGNNNNDNSNDNNNNKVKLSDVKKVNSIIDLLRANIRSLIANSHPFIPAEQRTEAINEANAALELVDKYMSGGKI